MRNDWDEGDYSDEDDPIVWNQKRNAQAARRNAPGVEALGQEAWSASTRTGANLVARTPSQVSALGARLMKPTQVDAAIGSDLIGSEGADRLRAAGRGAVDAVAVGNGDEVEALIGAVPAWLAGQGFSRSYQSALNHAHDQDRYDKQNYPVSRNVGEVVGTVGSLVATDGLAAAAAPRVAARGAALARTMPAMTKAEIWKARTAGAGLSMATQAASDAARHRRPDPRSYASAGLGGAVAVSSVRRLSPTYAAAASAVTTAAANAVLRGQAPSVPGLASAMTGAGYLAAGAQTAGARGSDSLDWRDKGKLGETLTEARLRAQGETITNRQQYVRLGQDRSTRPDFTLTPDPVTGNPRWPDAKFGPYARPSDSQKLAELIHPGSYQYYHWMPSHVGQISGAGVAAMAAPLFDRPPSYAGSPYPSQ